MNLYIINETLRKSKKAIFTIAELSRILNIKKEVISVYINRMVKKKMLFKVERGKVSITEDPFVIACQMIQPSFISLSTSFYLHGIMGQVIDKIYLITSKKRKNTKIAGFDVVFIKTNPKLMFGYKKIEKENSFITLADLEKTIIDCLLFQRYSRINYVIKALKIADIRKLEEYANRLDKEAINRRLGFLLDFLGKRHSFKKKTRTIYKLNPSIKSKGKFNSKWYLYINEELENVR